MTDKTDRLTEDGAADLNSVLDNRVFLTFGVKDVDVVQISKDWVKFRMAAKDATAVLQRSSVKPSRSGDMAKAVLDGGAKIMLDRGAKAPQGALDEKWKRITDALDSVLPRLVGTFQYVNDELFLPFGEDGMPVRDYETAKAGDETVFVAKEGLPDGSGYETRAELERPLAYRASVISVGDKLMIDSASFAYRAADYDAKTTPLRGFAEILGTEERSLDESVEGGLPPAAVRRLKLFDAAKHLGAEILERGGWTAAVCYKYEQCHVFGRLKPKVVPGTNEIDQACNLEDWEGITPENRAKRDDPELPWVKDGITDGHGHVFDKLSGESGQPRVSFGCETAWCNCGVLNRDGGWRARDRSNMYFEYYNNGGKTPYVIFMDMSRGALYQYVKIRRGAGSIVNFLNEDDKTDGGTFGNPPDRDQEAFFADFCNRRPEFREFVKEIDAAYFDA